MKEVVARANPGQLIVLDQCGQCGGIWCDKWELFPLDANAVEGIDPLNQATLIEPTKLTNKQLYCPRCTAELKHFAEPMLPVDIQLRRCGRCDGIWLNRGQLRRYKEYQRQTRLAKLGKEAIITQMPAAYQNPASWVVTGTKGIFAYPRGEPEAEDVVEKSLSAGAKVILQTLLRLVIGI
jgi:Zn-finger nucleic acid-binding protein